MLYYFNLLMLNIYQQIFQVLRNADNILLVSHENPDPDTIGSLGAITFLLEDLNKKYLGFCPTPIGRELNFIPRATEIKAQKDFNFHDFDVILTLDCGSLSRTGLAREIINRLPSQKYLNIDHHEKVDCCANLEIKDPKKAATTEIIYQFFSDNNLPITKAIAECILAGILADSENFLFPATSRENIRIAADLLARGANWHKITVQLHKSKSVAGLKAWGAILKRARINTDWKILFATAQKKDFLGIPKNEIEGLPNFLSTLADTQAALLLREEENGKWRGNLRSRADGADVSLLAQTLGGGGHTRTAGFSIEGLF